jgi:hypothetical protein
LDRYEENFFRNADGCFIAAAFCSGIVYAEKSKKLMKKEPIYREHREKLLAE